MRISITDRCNYKCVYCRTGNEGALYGDLALSDYLRMARVLAGMGIKKIRLTGGEPLLRGGLVNFVRELSQLQTVDEEPLDLALTTDGDLLADLAQPARRRRAPAGHSQYGCGRSGSLCRASRVCPMDTITCWRDFARRAGRGCGP